MRSFLYALLTAWCFSAVWYFLYAIWPLPFGGIAEGWLWLWVGTAGFLGIWMLWHWVLLHYENAFGFGYIGGLALGLGLAICGLDQFYRQERHQLLATNQREINNQYVLNRFKREVLRPPFLKHNGYAAYWALIGRPQNLPVSQSHSFFKLSEQDWVLIERMQLSAWGRMRPDPLLIQRFASQIQKLREAGHYPYIHYPPQPYQLEQPLAEIRLVQALHTLMLAQGVLNCQENRCFKGLQQAFDGVRFAQDFQAQGFLIPTIRAQALNKQFISQIMPFFQSASLTDRQRQQLQLEYQRLLASQFELMPQIVRNEFLMLEREMLKMAEIGRYFIHIRSGDEDHLQISWPARVYRSMQLLPSVLSMQQAFRELQQISVMYLQAQYHDPKLFQQLRYQQTQLQKYHPLLRTLVPDMIRVMKVYRENQAWMHGGKIWIALQRYHSKFGYYPPNLAELMPEWLDSLPLDPFSGKAFQYRLQGKHIWLYSIGANLINDGGHGHYQIYRQKKECDLAMDLVYTTVPIAGSPCGYYRRVLKSPVWVNDFCLGFN